MDRAEGMEEGFLYPLFSLLFIHTWGNRTDVPREVEGRTIQR
jgi:hypothetical protein